MKFFQKLGKAIMLPVACLPLCGILMGIGYLLCPASMQGSEISGVTQLIGLYLVKAGGAIIDNIAILFAVGVGVGMAKEKDSTAAITSLVSWLMLTTLLQPSLVTSIVKSVADNETSLLAFQKIQNPFIGILAGLIGTACYNRFKDTKLPDWLAFFSGKRSTIIVAGLVSVAAAAVLMFVWPLIFGGLVMLGKAISGMGPLGAGIYAFLNRLLIPFGLHHALNNVFWFDTIGLGDITHYWAGDTSADVSWSLGIYMSGFFPCMMFGVPGAALAMVQSAKDTKKKIAIGILSSAAVCAFVCGITEPFEFAFMFAAPVLYFVYALLYGIFTFLVALTGFRAGFAFSAGATDLLFSSSLPAAQSTWQIIPYGIAAFVIFYLVFRFMITRFNLKTPGREEDDVNEMSADGETSGDAQIVAGVNIGSLIDGLGGKDNVMTVDNCITRLRLEIKNMDAISEQTLKAAGAKGVMKAGKNALQVVIGMSVQSVADALSAALKSGSFGAKSADTLAGDANASVGKAKACAENKNASAGKAKACAENKSASVAKANTSCEKFDAPKQTIISCEAGKVLKPVTGRVISQADIPDETFATGILGTGVGIVPSEDKAVAPFDGVITSVTETNHAVGVESNGMEILIHVGIDTVKMKGEGFECLVKEGDTVKAGQPLILFDRAKIKAAGYSDIVAVMLINADDYEDVECMTD